MKCSSRSSFISGPSGMGLSEVFDESFNDWHSSFIFYTNTQCLVSILDGFSCFLSTMTPNNNSRFDGWTDLEKDILIRIFMTFNVVELIRGASVCKSWREAALEPCLWKILDLSMVEAENFRHQQPEQSSQRVMDIVNSAFSLSKGSVSCLILHFHAYITSQHLVCVSERY